MRSQRAAWEVCHSITGDENLMDLRRAGLKLLSAP
jgi:hypothetical protein